VLAPLDGVRDGGPVELLQELEDRDLRDGVVVFRVLEERHGRDLER
jgi:hypothetical protein